MNNKFTIIFLLLLVSGCVTPPGKLTDSDFIIKKYSIDTTVSDALGYLYEGLRYCGPYSGGALGFGVTHHGTLECAPIKNNGIVACDLYVERSSTVLGRVDFIPNKNGTSVELRVQSYAAGTDDILNAWQKFIANQSNEVCPK